MTTALLLTGTRSGEARGACWSEIDLDGALWTIPADRMKGAKQHRVPLSEAAMAILTRVAEVRTGDLVCSSVGRRSTTARRPEFCAVSATTRSRCTASDRRSATGAPIMASPPIWPRAALAHQVGSAVVRAYVRSDLLERRRRLMSNWVRYLTEPKVVPLPIRAAG
jgi:integrase